jgi:hypothetical protein
MTDAPANSELPRFHSWRDKGRWDDYLHRREILGDIRKVQERTGVGLAAIATATAAGIQWDKWNFMIQLADSFMKKAEANLEIGATLALAGLAGYASRKVARGAIAGFTALHAGRIWAEEMIPEFKLRYRHPGTTGDHEDYQTVWIVSAVNADGEALNTTVMRPSQYEAFLEKMDQSSAPIIAMHFDGAKMVKFEGRHEGKKVEADSPEEFIAAINSMRPKGSEADKVKDHDRDGPSR